MIAKSPTLIPHRTTAARPRSGIASARILLVDDDQIILDSLAEFLRLEGYEVETAGGVELALATLARKPCQLVISDVNMPRSDGFELLRAIRQRHPETV